MQPQQQLARCLESRLEPLISRSHPSLESASSTPKLVMFQHRQAMKPLIIFLQMMAFGVLWSRRQSVKTACLLQDNMHSPTCVQVSRARGLPNPSPQSHLQNATGQLHRGACLSISSKQHAGCRRKDKGWGPASESAFDRTEYPSGPKRSLATSTPLCQVDQPDSSHMYC